MNTPTKVRNSEFNDKKRARTEDYDSYDSDEEFDDCFSATANQSSTTKSGSASALVPYRNGGNGGFIRWTPEEDHVIRTAVEKFLAEEGPLNRINWETIAQLLPGRSVGAVRVRWFRSLKVGASVPPKEIIRPVDRPPKLQWFNYNGSKHESKQKGLHQAQKSGKLKSACVPSPKRVLVPIARSATEFAIQPIEQHGRKPWDCLLDAIDQETHTPSIPFANPMHFTPNMASSGPVTFAPPKRMTAESLQPLSIHYMPQSLYGFYPMLPIHFNVHMDPNTMKSSLTQGGEQVFQAPEHPNIPRPVPNHLINFTVNHQRVDLPLGFHASALELPKEP